MQAHALDIGLNIDAEEADRLELSLDLLGAALLRAGARGLARHRLRGAGLSEALHVRDRLADRPGAAQRPSPDGAAGQGRLLGRRDQARPARRAGRLSGLHAQDPHRRVLHRLRAEAAGGDRRGVPADRDPQCAQPGDDPRDRDPRGSTSSSACMAWARASTRRSSGRTSSSVPCRIYAPVGTHETLARLSRAPAAREWRQHLLREPDRRSGLSGRSSLLADPVEQARALDPVGRPHDRIALPRDLFGAERPNSMGLDLTNEQRLAALCKAFSRESWRAQPMLGDRPRDGAARASCAIRPTPATWSAPSSRRRRSWSMPPAPALWSGVPRPRRGPTACGGSPTGWKRACCR